MKLEQMFLHPAQSYQPIKIEIIEKKYNAKYVGDFCIMTKHGWSESPVAIFWQEKPPVEGYSHYFGIFVQEDTIYITSGESAFSKPIVGIVADDGEVVYSRYRHDFRSSKDGSVFIDGGRDYTKWGGTLTPQFVHIVADGATLKIVGVK